MINNFVLYGLLSILLFYGISSYGIIFGESNNNTDEYQFLKKFGGKGNEDGQLTSPHSIDIDKEGNVYVTDTGNDRIQKYDLDGKFILKWGFEDTGGQGAKRTPHQLTVDSDGYVYLTDKNAHQILKFDENGKFIQSYGSKGSTEGKFLEPHGIVFDSNNTMYVTDMKNSRVQVFGKDFNFKRQWGSFGNASGQFSGTAPGIDLYEKEEDLVFVVDKTSTNFQVFDENGKFISKFGSKGKQDGQFNRPEDLAIDLRGNVFIADTGNSRIQVFGTK